MPPTGPPTPTLEVQKSYWDEKWDWCRTQYPHDRALRRGDKILAYVRSLGLERPVILDLGCGTGWFANQLARLGPTVGVDLSEEGILQAKSQFPQVTFEAGDVYEMDLPERHFDVVVSQEVIAHVPDQAAYLAIAARVLKPGGHLIVTTPNRFVHERHRWPDQHPGHIERWLSRGDLRRLVQERFQVLATTTAVPLGNRGVLRVVNSTRLNRALGALFGAARIEDLKEWAGFGWTQIVLARRKA